MLPSLLASLLATVALLAPFLLPLAFTPPPALLEELARRAPGVVFSLPRPSPRTLYLTIDDGPTEYTPEILEALSEVGAPALFFVIGERVRALPNLTRHLTERGHQLGNHDFESRLTAAPWRSTEEIREGLLATEAAAQEAQAGPLTRWTRPGSGLYTGRLLGVTRSLGQTVLLGDIYAHDCQLAWLPFLKRFYAWRASEFPDASVVILHDGSARRARNTAAVIRHLAAQGFSFAPVPAPPPSPSFTRV